MLLFKSGRLRSWIEPHEKPGGVSPSGLGPSAGLSVGQSRIKVNLVCWVDRGPVLRCVSNTLSVSMLTLIAVKYAARAICELRRVRRVVQFRLRQSCYNAVLHGPKLAKTGRLL